MTDVLHHDPVTLTLTLVPKIENGKEKIKRENRNEKENKKKLSLPLSALTILQKQI